MQKLKLLQGCRIQLHSRCRRHGWGLQNSKLFFFELYHNIYYTHCCSARKESLEGRSNVVMRKCLHSLSISSKLEGQNVLLVHGTGHVDNDILAGSELLMK